MCPQFHTFPSIYHAAHSLRIATWPISFPQSQCDLEFREIGWLFRSGHSQSPIPECLSNTKNAGSYHAPQSLANYSHRCRRVFASDEHTRPIWTRRYWVTRVTYSDFTFKLSIHACILSSWRPMKAIRSPSPSLNLIHHSKKLTYGLNMDILCDFEVYIRIIGDGDLARFHFL
jgi:hypothetical protein